MPLGDFEARTAYHLRQAFVKEIKSSRERCRSKMEKKILQMLATIIRLSSSSVIVLEYLI